jgi:hypothetical protein
VYYDVLEEYNETCEKLDEIKNTLEDWEEIITYEIAYEKAYKKDCTTFRELVEIKKTILRCRIVMQKTFVRTEPRWITTLNYFIVV